MQTFSCVGLRHVLHAETSRRNVDGAFIKTFLPPLPHAGKAWFSWSGHILSESTCPFYGVFSHSRFFFRARRSGINERYRNDDKVRLGAGVRVVVVEGVMRGGLPRSVCEGFAALPSLGGCTAGGARRALSAMAVISLELSSLTLDALPDRPIALVYCTGSYCTFEGIDTLYHTVVVCTFYRTSPSREQISPGCTAIFIQYGYTGVLRGWPFFVPPKTPPSVCSV